MAFVKEKSEVLGEELILNGTFDNNIDSPQWTDGSLETGSIAWNAGGYMDIINPSAAAPLEHRGRARLLVAGLEPGATYKFSFKIDNAINHKLSLGYDGWGAHQYSPNIWGESRNPPDATFIVYFKAVNQYLYGVFEEAANNTMKLDDVSLKKSSHNMEISKIAPSNWNRTGHFTWLITSPEEGTTTEPAFTISFWFSPTILTSFTLDDIVTENCTLSDFTPGLPLSSATATCTPNSDGPLKVFIPYGAIEATTGAKNSSGTPFEIIKEWSNNYSILFDASANNVIDLRDGATNPPEFPLGDSARTLSAWVKPTTVVGGPYQILSYGNNQTQGSMLWSQSNQKLVVDQYGGTKPTTGNIMVADTWQHVVLIATGGVGVLMYRNGVEVLDEDFDEVLDTVHGNYGTTIGGIFWSTVHIQTYPGLIDEVSIWNVALDDDAVTEIYNDGTPIDLTKDKDKYVYSDNLQGYWRFEENDGLSTVDSSGNGYTGTLTNGPTWSSTVPS